MTVAWPQAASGEAKAKPESSAARIIEERFILKIEMKEEIVKEENCVVTF